VNRPKRGRHSGSGPPTGRVATGSPAWWPWYHRISVCQSRSPRRQVFGIGCGSVRCSRVLKGPPTHLPDSPWQALHPKACQGFFVSRPSSCRASATSCSYFHSRAGHNALKRPQQVLANAFRTVSIRLPGRRPLRMAAPHPGSPDTSPSAPPAGLWRCWTSYFRGPDRAGYRRGRPLWGFSVAHASDRGGSLNTDRPSGTQAGSAKMSTSHGRRVASSISTSRRKTPSRTSAS
jgi:hypothetical protein